MRKATVYRPQYADQFRCIAADCEDSCCVGWTVAIDKATYKKYKRIPAGPLRTLIDENVLRTGSGPDRPSDPASFASVRMSAAGQCPMQNAARLCQIQLKYGADYLSRTCATFPRATYTIDHLRQTTLTLSCPEASRLVLSHDDLLGDKNAEPVPTTWDDAENSKVPAIRYFWPIREFTVTLLRNRSFPLWQRLFLLGTFCRRLESITHGNMVDNFPALERGFSHALSTGTLGDSIAAIPINNPLQLDMILEFAKSRVVAGNLPARFRESWDYFMHGIQSETLLTFEGRCVAYAASYERYYAPFFAEHERILENLLLNMVLRSVFPFGPHIFGAQATPIQPARQYALLVIEFALIKGLLIGIAGSRKEKFSVEDVVQIVQVVVKHFEHNSTFLSRSLEALSSKGLNTAYGLTMLVRN